MGHFGTRGWQRGRGDNREGCLQDWGVCRDVVPTDPGVSMERQGAGRDAGPDKDAPGKRLFWQSNLALYQAPVSPGVPHRGMLNPPGPQPLPQLRGARADGGLWFRALLPTPARLLDAAWLGAGGRQVTSPKVNADGCTGINIALQPPLSRA